MERSTFFNVSGKYWHNCPIFINSNFKTTTIFMMKKSSKLPRTVARIAANRQYIIIEYEIIDYLRNFSQTTDYLPIPLRFENKSSRPISYYEFIEGVPIGSSKTTSRKLFQKYLERICTFLKELASIPVPQFLRNCEADLDRKLYYAQSASKRNSSVTKIIELVKISSEYLSNAGVNKVIVHGDLNFSNVLLSGTNIKIVDWEFVTVGYSIIDFVHFVLSYWQDVPLIERGSFFLKLLNKGALSHSLMAEMGKLADPGLSVRDIKYLLTLAIFCYYFKELYYKIEKLALIEPTFLALDRLDLENVRGASNSKIYS